MPTVKRSSSQSRSYRNRRKNKTGGGIINSLINKLPIELHLLGLLYYPLKAATWLVTNIMKGKQRFGMGCQTRLMAPINKKRSVKVKGRKVAFGSGIIRKVRDVMKKRNSGVITEKNIHKASKIAVSAACQALKNVGGKRKIRIPRIIPIPKTGGILPLLPIFASLSALGTLAGGMAGVSKVISDVRMGKQRLAEAERYNRNMEAIALGKSGKGLYLKPYRSGLGLYLGSNDNNNNSRNY